MSQALIITSDNQQVVATLTGAITHINYGSLWTALSAMKIPTSAKVVVLDCQQVSKVDSSALALILALQRLFRQQGKQFTIKAPVMLKQLAKLYGI